MWHVAVGYVASWLVGIGFGFALSRTSSWRGGADWEQIAAALGRTPQVAWDDFTASVSAELDAEEAASARELAGARPAG